MLSAAGGGQFNPALEQGWPPSPCPVERSSTGSRESTKSDLVLQPTVKHGVQIGTLQRNSVVAFCRRSSHPVQHAPRPFHSVLSWVCCSDPLCGIEGGEPACVAADQFHAFHGNYRCRGEKRPRDRLPVRANAHCVCHSSGKRAVEPVRAAHHSRVSKR